MIYTTKKYSSLQSFILQDDEKARIQKYTLAVGECKAITDEYKITNACFYCNFCKFGQLSSEYCYKFNHEISKNYNPKNFFQGYRVKVPKARFHCGLKNHEDIESFTSIKIGRAHV